jgi:predicted Zn finger-like uncharacterized protein
MKFICPNCKAKYQIADERVAGRSVKMKCRQCGHLIPISRADAVPTESAPAPAAEPEPPVQPQAPAANAPIAEAPKPAAAPPPPPAARSGPSIARPLGAKLPSRAAPLPRVTASSPGSAPSAAAKPPEKPAASAPLRVVPPSSASASASGAKPPEKPASVVARPLQVNRPQARPPPRSAPRAAPAPAKSPEGGPEPSEPEPIRPGSLARPEPSRPRAVEPRRPATVDQVAEKPAPARAHAAAPPRPGALAGAFAHALGGSAAAALDELKAPAEEWYIGINNVPVGPVHFGQIRGKAALGAITMNSLVWKDGLEEWQPLKHFPELAAIVEESVASARAAAVAWRPSQAEPAAAQAPVRIETVGEVSDPFALPRTPAVVAVAPTAAELEAAGIGRPRGTSPAAWFALVVALAFGLTAGWFLFGGQKKETVVQYVAVAASGGPALPQPAQPGSAVVAGDETASSSGKSARKTARAAGPGAVDKAPDQGESAGLKGLKGLQGLPASGPEGPSGGPARPAGGQQLDSAQVQRTVTRYTGSVKRSCWQPALDARDQDAPTSAKVSVSLQVAPSGSVQDVTTSGDPKGYRGLAACIASRVRGWQFPPASESTTVNVPFVFAAQ